MEVTRTIGKKENVWVQSLVVKEIQGGDKREFLVKRYLGPSSQHLSDGEEEKCTAVDICKIRPSRPLNLCAEYELLNIVEVFVGYGWRKGVVREVDIDNNYKVCFEDTKEEAVLKTLTLGGSWSGKTMFGLKHIWYFLALIFCSIFFSSFGNKNH